MSSMRGRLGFRRFSSETSAPTPSGRSSTHKRRWLVKEQEQAPSGWKVVREHYSAAIQRAHAEAHMRPTVEVHQELLRNHVYRLLSEWKLHSA